MRNPAGLFLRQAVLTRVGAATASAAIAFALSVEARRAGPSWIGYSIIGVILVCIYLEVWFFRDADGFVDGHVGERIVERALGPLEEDGYRILGPRRWGGRGDIDQIVVGPTGVFAIEVKAWRGRVAWRGDRLIVAGIDRTETARKSVIHAMQVKKRIPRELGVDWVEAVTVFAKRYPRVGCRHKKRYWAVPADDLAGFIRSRTGRLTHEECAYIASALN